MARNDKITLSLLVLSNVPVFRCVFGRVYDQVYQFKAGISFFQGFQVDGFEPLFIIEIGFLGQGVRDIVIFIPRQYPFNGDFLRAICL
jgi:hypothetical protein